MRFYKVSDTMKMVKMMSNKKTDIDTLKDQVAELTKTVRAQAIRINELERDVDASPDIVKMSKAMQDLAQFVAEKHGVSVATIYFPY